MLLIKFNCCMQYLKTLKSYCLEYRQYDLNVFKYCIVQNTAAVPTEPGYDHIKYSY